MPPPYSSTLMEHVLDPKNGGAMERPDAVGESSLNGRAPYTHIYLKVTGDWIQQAMFQTFGCGVSIAACSVLTELVKDRSVTDCAQIQAAEVIKALDGVPRERAFCIDLAITAFRDALSKLVPPVPT